MSSILIDCGCFMMHSEHVKYVAQKEMLHQLVFSGDEGLIALLESSELSRLTERNRDNLLNFFSTRRTLSSQLLKKIKSFPLFLSVHPRPGEDKFLPLTEPGVTFVYLIEDLGLKTLHVSSLSLLSISSVRVLAHPHINRTPIFNLLGVKCLTASQFMIDFVCPQLTSIDLRSTSESIVLELFSWVCAEASTLSVVDDVINAIKKCLVVVPQRGQLTAMNATKFLDPRLKVATLFKSTLEHVFPQCLSPLSENDSFTMILIFPLKQQT